MKGEYREEQQHSTTSMFSKIHQTHNLPPHPLQPYLQTPSPNSPSTTHQNDGASIEEVTRRPRGRPAGSKNKPKPPIIITRPAPPTMTPYLLEIPTGSDLINSITLFSHRHNSGLCILNGSGTVTNVTLKQPSTANGTVTFHGRFEMLSMSGTILPSSVQNIINNFTITLAGPQGQIVGGAVVAPLVAASTVYVFATSFNDPAYHRLPTEDEQQENNNNNNINSGDGGADVASLSGGSGGGESGGGMPIYSCHGLGTDVIWAPTPRQPQAYP